MATDTPPWEKYAAAQQKAPVDDTAAWNAYAGVTAPQPTTQAAATAAPSGPAETMHRLGVLGRGLVEGPTSTAGMIGDALNTGINMAGSAIGHNPQLAMPSAALQQGLNAAGFPQAQNTTEKVVQGLASIYTGSKDPLMGAITKGLAPAASRQPTVRESALLSGQKLGYVAPPSELTGNATGNVLEGISDKRSLYNSMELKNQDTTNKVMRQVVGLSADTPITEDAIKNAMDATAKAGYAPIRNIGNITTGSVYRKALDNVITDNHGTSGFPFSQDVQRLVDSYRLSNFNSGAAIDAISQLRAQAYNHMLDPNVRNAARGIAKALESNIELNLQNKPNAADLLNNFKDARVQLAKQRVVLDALNSGSGDVNAIRIVNQQLNRKGENYLTGDLSTVANFAKNAPTVSRMPNAQSVPIIRHPMANMLSTVAAGFMGGPSSAAMVGGLPYAQAGIRHALMSPTAQRMLAPQLDPGILARLSHNPDVINALPAAYAASGLYGPRN